MEFIEKQYNVIIPIASVFLFVGCAAVSFFPDPMTGKSWKYIAGFLVSGLVAAVAIAFIIAALEAKDKVEDGTKKRSWTDTAMETFLTILLALLLVQYIVIDAFVLVKVEKIDESTSAFLTTWVNATVGQSLVVVLAIFAKGLLNQNLPKDASDRNDGDSAPCGESGDGNPMIDGN